MTIALLVVAAAAVVAAPEPGPAATRVTPIGNPGLWVRVEDYPPEALRASEHGTTGFSLLVGADGRPTSCEVTQSSGSARLDDMACRALMFRAEFTPARDARGVAMVDVYTSVVRWLLPPARPPALNDLTPVSTEIVLVITEQGAVESCEARVLVGSPEVAYPLCASASGGFTRSLPVERRMAPVRRRVTLRHSIEVEALEE